MGAGWVVVVPVKPLSRAKSRLRGALPGTPHDGLVRALVLDTVAAALACPVVSALVVVTTEASLVGDVTGLGGRVVPDPADAPDLGLDDAPDPGLNGAFRRGERAAAGAPVAALAGDLPALRPAELAEALSRVDGRRRYVADAPGTGTTLLAAPAGVPLDPRFGPGSARAHAESGALPLTGDWPSLRRDVDTPADLAAAVALGVGPRLAALLAADLSTGRAGPAGTVGGVQGTVGTYDEATGDGTVLLDDGTELAFPGTAVAAGGLRLLRSGQRVRLVRTGDEITAVTLITMPVPEPPGPGPAGSA